MEVDLVRWHPLPHKPFAIQVDPCGEIMAGHSTSDIAGRLFISTNTVQDHLKSVFGKVGVRSRGELVARLRPNGSIPQEVAQPEM